MAEEPSWWDKLLYGEKGRAAGPPPAPSHPPFSRLFAQLDTDGDGSLSEPELRRALQSLGIDPRAATAAFEAMDADGDARLSYEELVQGCAAGVEGCDVIERALGEDGVLDSLYVPPEEWDETGSAEEVRWEQKVRFQAQRSGNAVRQNDILNNELGKG